MRNLGVCLFLFVAGFVSVQKPETSAHTFKPVNEIKKVNLPIKTLPSPLIDKSITDLLSDVYSWENGNISKELRNKTPSRFICGYAERRSRVIRKVNKLASSGKYREALIEVSNAISATLKYPGWFRLQPNWYIAKAKLHRLLGEQENANKSIEQVLPLMPLHNRCQFSSARVLIELGKYSKAEHILQSLINNKCNIYNNQLFYFYLAYSQESQGNLDEAVNNYISAATLFMSVGKGICQ